MKSDTFVDGQAHVEQKIPFMPRTICYGCIHRPASRPAACSMTFERRRASACVALPNRQR
jgi:hypothetical protein